MRADPAEFAERLRPRLRVFRGADGRELFDLPDAPRPDPDIPAPPRFLPEYDNVLLSHADRSRIIPGRRSVPLPPGHGGSRGTVLVDGFWAATWRADRADGGAVLRVEPFTPLGRGQAGAVTAEAARLLAFVAPDDTCDVQFEGPT
ncbi:MAG TPA: crosslink repair DNA glycosylase YcaQ family protein [Streptosporangiaceae bacterium]